MATHVHFHDVLHADRDRIETNATKLTLITLFLGVLGTFSTNVVRDRPMLRLSPFDLVQLGLSSFRIGRMVAFEGVGAPLRAPFTETRPDDSGAGDTVVAEGTGARRAIGELLSCPICAGTWVAAGLVYGLHLAPRPTRLLLAIMSTTGLAQVLYDATEAMSWSAEAARRQCAG